MPYSNDNDIGLKLLRLRKSVSMSRSYIEKKYDICAATIRHWESRKTAPPRENLERYLKIFRYEGINIDSDTLLNETVENLSNEIEEKLIIFPRTTDDFFKTSFALESLSKDSNLILYANLQGEILFLNKNFNYFLNQNTNCNLSEISVFITDLAPEIEKILNNFLSKVLQGISIIVECDFKKENKKISLQLRPNYFCSKTIVGFSIINVV